MSQISKTTAASTFGFWQARSNEITDRINQFAISESKLYANTVIANNVLKSLGNTVLGSSGKQTVVNGLITANGRMTISTNLSVSGNTTLGAAGKTQTSTGVWSHTGNMSISGNTSIAGLKANSSLGSSGYFLRTNGTTAYWDALPPSTQYLQVANAAVIYTTKINPTTSGIFAHTGRATISTNLAVTGNTSSNKSTVTSSFTVSGNSVFGASGKHLIVNGTLKANGTVDIASSDMLNQTLTDGATINWDTSLGQVATVTLGGDRTMAAPTNIKVGTYILKVVQDGTGSRTLTWNGLFKWTAQTAPVLSTAAGSIDVFSFFSDGSKLYGAFLPDVR